MCLKKESKMKKKSTQPSKQMENDSADWPDICLYVYGEAWS